MPWKVDTATVTLIFERIFFHNGRNAGEIENKTAWKDIVRGRVARFRKGDVRGLWEDAKNSAPTPDPDKPALPPDNDL